MTTPKRRIWGWFFFDWSSQPYNTLLMTFIFAPYMASIMKDGTAAQTIWGYGIGAAGILIALGSPLLGTIADHTGGRMRFILLFSLMYVIGSWGLWCAAPNNLNIWLVMASFGIGLLGMEFATTFTNSLLPDLGTREEIGRISGSGWAFGYLGGVVSLIFVLCFLAENPEGKTLLGGAPLFGLDAEAREGTRAVGPFTAIWYAVFMIPFFLWVREPRKTDAISVSAAARRAWPDLKQSLRSLPRQRSLFAFLISSMLYRDALNGMFTFGGIYAAGVLGWSVTFVGIFGILAAITGAIFTWLGGHADSRFGPKPVIMVCLMILSLVAISIVFVSREGVFGLAVGPESHLPDIAFFLLGGLIGAAGGSIQAASRTMMVRQADPERITEAFGLYALAGKATSFIAPLAIGVVTAISQSQSAGITPLVVLFLIGLILLVPVRPQGDHATP